MSTFQNKKRLPKSQQNSPSDHFDHIEAVPIYNAIVENIEKEKLRKQKENANNQYEIRKEPSDKKLSEAKKDTQETRTASKVAEVFGTNRDYVNKAKKLKEEITENRY